MTKSSDGTITVHHSPRAGGSYKVSEEAIGELRSLEDYQKARLTYQLVKARQRGTVMPGVDRSLMAAVRAGEPTRVHDRAVGLLEFLAANTDHIGAQTDLSALKREALAWSESNRFEEVAYLVGYLQEKDWVEQWGGGWQYRVTVDGHSFLENQRTAQVSGQAFVAMWFDPSMDTVYTEGIKPAIRGAGYEPLRIDGVEHINRIDDEIIREIRRSRFVVADFTSGSDGARGSVYYEAGFAHGLGIPVIPTCRRDQNRDIAFDTR